jgi:hypothetical protein
MKQQSINSSWPNKTTQSINKCKIFYIKAANNKNNIRSKSKKKRKLQKHAKTSQEKNFHLAVTFWNASFPDPSGANKTPKSIPINVKPVWNSDQLIQVDQKIHAIYQLTHDFFTFLDKWRNWWPIDAGFLSCLPLLHCSPQGLRV